MDPSRGRQDPMSKQLWLAARQDTMSMAACGREARSHATKRAAHQDTMVRAAHGRNGGGQPLPIQH